VDVIIILSISSYRYQWIVIGTGKDNFIKINSIIVMILWKPFHRSSLHSQ